MVDSTLNSHYRRLRTVLFLIAQAEAFLFLKEQSELATNKPDPELKLACNYAVSGMLHVPLYFNKLYVDTSLFRASHRNL